MGVFDCRFDLADTQRGERAHTTAHVPGAFYAHIDRDLSEPDHAGSLVATPADHERLRDWLGRHGLSSATQVVVYDGSGGTMAVRLWWLLRWLGHTGSLCWTAAGPPGVGPPCRSRTRRHGR